MPARELSNEEFVLVAESTYNPKTITRVTGIESRHWASEGETNASLALAAAEQALENAEVEIGEIGEILLATNSPDVMSPSMSSFVAGGLGVREECSVADVNVACAGGIFALGQGADNMMSGRNKGLSLVIGSEVISRGLERGRKRTMSTTLLFGDGAGAVVLDRRPGSIRPESQTLTVPDWEAIHVNPETGALFMDGTIVSKHAARLMPKAARMAARKAGLILPNNDYPNTPDTIDWGDIDAFVPHQANLLLMRSVADILGVPKEKFIDTSVRTHGNTSGASALIALAKAYESGRIESGQKTLLFTSVGAGMVSAATVIGSQVRS